MIEFEFENNGCFVYDVEVKPFEARINFHGKNYKTNTEDHVIIKNIFYKDLVLPELFEYTKMSTDSDNDVYKNLKNVNYVSFNGIWELKFTEDDIKKILKKKLS